MDIATSREPRHSPDPAPIQRQLVLAQVPRGARFAMPIMLSAKIRDLFAAPQALLKRRRRARQV